jgi:hypothetical protein
MQEPDHELEEMRAGISCAAILEHAVPAWRLDHKESTPHCLKYRRGAGEVLIVNHGGRGWWDPGSDTKGDVFKLVQYLDPTLNFGHVRKTLRPFIGLSPRALASLPARCRSKPGAPMSDRWAARPPLRSNSSAWHYLSGIRRLPVSVLGAAARADAIREGWQASAWFAHRDRDGRVCHVEVRGPSFKGSLRGGRKTLFRLVPIGFPSRIVIAEAPIDCLSIAAIEGLRPGTRYVATGGGMGPQTIEAIQDELAAIAGAGDAVLCSATDDDRAGDRYAVQHRRLAEAAGVTFERLTPPVASGDWNDALRRGKAA